MLACKQSTASAFAKDHGLTTWATTKPLFVSPYDGSTYYGEAEVSGKRLLPNLQQGGTLDRFEPGRTQPLPAEEAGPSPLPGLTPDQAEDHQGPWEERAGGLELELLHTLVEWPGGSPEFLPYLVKAHRQLPDGRKVERFKLVRDDGSGGALVEVVTVPMRMLDGEETTYPDPVEVFTGVRDAIERLLSVPPAGPGWGVPLVELFPARDGFQVHPDARGATVRHVQVEKEGRNSVYVQQTVGVPLGGVYPFLQFLAARTRRLDVALPYLQEGLVFGAHFGRLFATDEEVKVEDEEVEDEEVEVDLSVPGLAELAGYLAVLYTTAAAQVHVLVLPRHHLVKNYLVAAPRNSMASMRGLLPGVVQDFLNVNAEKIVTQFLSFYLKPRPYALDSALMMADENEPGLVEVATTEEGGVDLLNSRLRDHSVGEYLESALSRSATRVIDPNEALGVRTFLKPEERDGGSLFHFELRRFGQYTTPAWAEVLRTTDWCIPRSVTVASLRLGVRWT